MSDSTLDASTKSAVVYQAGSGPSTYNPCIGPYLRATFEQLLREVARPSRSYDRKEAPLIFLVFLIHSTYLESVIRPGDIVCTCLRKSRDRIIKHNEPCGCLWLIRLSVRLLHQFLSYPLQRQGTYMCDRFLLSVYDPRPLFPS